VQGLKVYGGVETDVHSLLNPTPDDECSLTYLLTYSLHGAQSFLRS